MGRRLGLPVVHLDQHRFIPNTHYEPLPKEVFQAKVAELAKPDRWIIEGAFKSAVPTKIERATTIIYLAPSRWVGLYRYIRLCRRIRAQQERRIGVTDYAKTEFEWGMVHWILFDFPSDAKEIQKMLKGYQGRLIKASSVTF